MATQDRVYVLLEDGGKWSVWVSPAVEGSPRVQLEAAGDNARGQWTGGDNPPAWVRPFSDGKVGRFALKLPNADAVLKARLIVELSKLGEKKETKNARVKTPKAEAPDVETKPIDIQTKDGHGWKWMETVKGLKAAKKALKSYPTLERRALLPCGKEVLRAAPKAKAAGK